MWNSNNLNDHFNASGNLELLALYIAEDHFNDNNTIIIGDAVINGYVMFNINDIDSDEVKEMFDDNEFMLTNEVKQSIKNIHSSLTINKEQLQMISDIGDELIDSHNDSYDVESALMLQNFYV